MQLTKLLARLGLAAFALSTLNFQLSTARAQGTAFTYQGVLSQNGAAINGSNDLTFTLYNAANAGATVGTSNVVNDLAMSNGLFTVTLDFGAGAFDGTARWLQIAARPGASTGAYTNIAPRTPITPTPYAMFAGGAAAAGVTGTISPTNLPNGLGGSANTASGLVATVAGGNNNTASGTQSTVGGGVLNVASGFRSTVPGGLGNIASGDYSFAAGQDARATNQGAFVWADSQNAFFDSTNNDSFNVRAQGGVRFVTSGKGMSLDGPLAVAVGAVIGNGTVLGLNIHDTLNRGSKVSFGYNVPGSEFNGMRAVVNPGTFGCGNSGDLLFYTWECNTAVSREVMRINGRGNVLTTGNVGIGQTAPGFPLNFATALGDKIALFENVAGQPSFGFGIQSSLLQIHTSDAGSDVAFGYGSSAAMTETMRIKGNGNVGIGTDAPATKLTVNAPYYGIEHTYGAVRLTTYVDPDGGWLGTISPHDLLFFVNNGSAVLRLSTNNNAYFLGEISATAVNITSDRNAKEQFKPVNAREVLAKVARLPISEWQYKTQDDARHIGPMAQDFREAFTLGHDEKHISTVDEGGVALAAIQGLNEKLEEKTQEVDALKKSVAALTELVNKLAAQQNGGAK